MVSRHKNKPLNRRPRRRRSFLRNENGTAAIEFALSAPLFFLMTLGLFDITIYFTADRVLDAGVERIAREVRTGNMQLRAADPSIGDPGFSPADFRNAVCNDNIIRILFDCEDLMLDVQTVTAFQDTPTDRNADGSVNTSNFGIDPGGSCEITVIRAFAEWPTVLPNWRLLAGEDPSTAGEPDMSRLIRASAGFRNECF